MNKLSQAIKELMDKEPFIGGEENMFHYAKASDKLIQAIEDAGFFVEAHQGGIRGTTILIVPKI